MTELQTLKAKCYNSDGSVKKGVKPADLARYKHLQDGEPLSKADLENAKKREKERLNQRKADFQAKMKAKAKAAGAEHTGAAAAMQELPPDEAVKTITVGDQAKSMKAMAMSAPPGAKVPAPTLDQPAEHPRIVELKDALRIFTQIEAHDSRPDDFVLFTREVSITAGDVRRARKAMKA